jgi:hypothetical protein
VLFGTVQAHQLKIFGMHLEENMLGHSSVLTSCSHDLDSRLFVLRAVSHAARGGGVGFGAVVRTVMCHLEACVAPQLDQTVAAATKCVDTMLTLDELSSTSALRQLAAQFYRVLSRQPRHQPEKPHMASNVAAVAQMLLALVSNHSDRLLPEYDTLFASTLRGLADFDSAVRVPCVQAFKALVPLASLAQAIRSATVNGGGQNNSVVSEGCSPLPARELLDHIFTKSEPLRLQHSTHRTDQRVLAVLAQQTNLVAAHDGAGAHKDLSPSPLREYQWEGISWLTQLRRFGLSGILADEM